jgi:hypothetical protein
LDDLEQLLSTAAQRFEPEVKRRLTGLLGGLVRAYLPQSWVFRTDHGTATLRVDPTGSTSVAGGAEGRPDVTIEIPLKFLQRALASRDPAAPPPDQYTVMPHTVKGKAAFDYLRSRLGL